MIRRFTYFVFFLVWWGFSSFACSLELRIFDVGQANFVVMKSGGHSLVVDCGIAKKLIKKEQSKFDKELGEFLAHTAVGIVITHQHNDHYSYIDRLRTIVGANLRDVYVGGPYSSKTSAKLNFANFCEVCNGGRISRKTGPDGTLHLNSFDGLLGRDVRIELLLPRTSTGISEHDQNLVLKITYAGRSILLPGDASGRLIDRIATDKSKMF